MSLCMRRVGHGEPPLVFVHGWGFNGTVWESTVSRLKDQHVCLMVDLPGFGASAPLQSEYSLSVLSAALTKELPSEAVWIGWSLGGMVALQAAMDQPVSVSSLVLVASTPRFVQTPSWPHAVPSAVLQEFAAELKEDYEKTLGRFVALQARGSRNYRETVRNLSYHLKLACHGGKERV